MSESNKEKWIMSIALTTMLLAVLTIVASFRGASYANKAQLRVAAEAHREDTFLADSIKEHSYRLQMEVFELSKLLGRSNPDVEKFIERKVKEYDDEISRYEKEKDQIAQNTDKMIREQADYGKHSSTFALAILFLQTAVLISSACMLANKRLVWYAGLCSGVLGFLCMLNGFFLWF